MTRSGGVGGWEREGEKERDGNETEREKGPALVVGGGRGGGVRCPEATLEMEEGWETERDPLRRVRLRLLCAPVSTAGRAEEVPPPPPALAATRLCSLPSAAPKRAKFAMAYPCVCPVRLPDASSIPCSPPCSPLSFLLIRGHPSLQRPFIICHFWGQLGAG